MQEDVLSRRDGKSRFSPLQAALPCVFSVMLLTACGKAPAPEVARAEDVPSGEQVFAMSCAVCHYDGSASATAPPLAGSPVLKQSADAVIDIILRGQSGKTLVDGKPFNGVMPAQEYLSDAEIAAVVAYVRSKFGGVEAAVSADAVKKLRAAGAP